MTTITNLEAFDLRFDTSSHNVGTDAMNLSSDYSAAYVVLKTDNPDLSGHGLTFTTGRSNGLCVSAIRLLKRLIVGKTLEEITADMAGFYAGFTGDSQLRWVGPDKGVIHLATSAIVNAVWDLWAKAEEKPVWQLVRDMTPEEIVGCINFTYLSNAITPDEALELLYVRRDGRESREARLQEEGFPGYSTSVGWLGYDNDKLSRLVKEALAEGWTQFKLKVGGDLKRDQERCALVRELIGPDCELMIDANQVWEVQEAIDWVNALQGYDIRFIEEPTSPDDILGHRQIKDGVAPILVATGEMCHNQVMFKQFLQLDACDVIQLDPARLGGMPEILAVLLLAAKYGKPVCPHGGGVGLCEYIQHVSMIDYLVFSGEMEGRVLEYVDHLHEHFLDPCDIRNGRYFPPTAAGFSIEMKEATLKEHCFNEK